MQQAVAQFLLPYSDRLFKIGVIGIFALIAIAIVDVVARRFMTHAPTKRAKTLLTVFSNIIKFGIFIIAVIAGLSVWKINITPLLASAGIVGLAVGFGSQVLVKDIISGIFFIFENQFNAGDIVEIGDVKGVVETVGLRTISVRDESGALHIIPNGSVAQLANLSSRWSSAVVSITVSNANDIDKVYDTLVKLSDEIAHKEGYKEYILAEPKVYALDELTDSKMTFKVVIRANPGKQEKIEQHFRYMVKKDFDKEKIAFS